MIHERREIEAAMAERFDAVSAFIKAQPDELFEKQVNERWTTGQELDHLVRSVKPLHLALSLPKLALGLRFGKCNHELRNYDGCVAVYKKALAEGGKASGQFVPPPVPLAKKAALLAEYDACKQKLLQLITKWDDKGLDTYVVPHPLIGKMTIREILMWTVYHNEHHLGSLQTHYGYEA